MLSIFGDRMFVLVAVYPPLTGHGRFCRLFHSRFGRRICFNRAPGTLIIHSRGRKVVSSGTYLRTYLLINKVRCSMQFPGYNGAKHVGKHSFQRCYSSSIPMFPLCTRVSLLRLTTEDREKIPTPAIPRFCSDEPEIVLSASPRGILDRASP